MLPFSGWTQLCIVHFLISTTAVFCNVSRTPNILIPAVNILKHYVNKFERNKDFILNVRDVALDFRLGGCGI